MNSWRRFWQKLIWEIQAFPSGFVMGDRGWANMRLLVVLIASGLFMFLGGVIFERQALLTTVLRWQLATPNLQKVPTEILMLPALLFTKASLRYLIAPLAAIVGAFLVGARYVQDIYEIKKYGQAFQYLFASVFGLGYPSLIIEEGKPHLKPDEENLLVAIGGPGYVVIRPGNIVLFENLRNPSGVRAEGYHFISRFETIKEIANLEDQHDHIDELEAVTKDGIEVVARDINFRYRLWSSRKVGGQNGRTPSVPYPYSIQAVRNLAYNRVVRNGEYSNWADTVRRQFSGEIQNYIRRNQVDQVTAPRNFEETASGKVRGNPREDIHRIYESPEIRDRFKNIGAQLLWYGIGHFEVNNPLVNDQRVSTWQAGWRGDAKKTLAYSEAKKMAYVEQGRAEAQAEILLGIVHALDDIKHPGEERDKNLQEIFLVRMAQLLEAMRGERKSSGGEE